MVLIDADIVGFRCAASCKDGDPFEVCITRIDSLMQQILDATDSAEYVSCLSGARNWRKEFYPDYKANRTQQPPVFLQPAKEYLVNVWKSIVSDGIEADDEIGINKEAHPTAIIASIDKDFKQFPGTFYNFVTGESERISQRGAIAYFYKQLILGDKSDNVGGYDGKPRAKPTNPIKEWYAYLEFCTTELDMYEVVLEAYAEGGGDLNTTAQLLYIWRKNPDVWIPPTERASWTQLITEPAPEA